MEFRWSTLHDASMYTSERCQLHQDHVGFGKLRRPCKPTTADRHERPGTTDRRVPSFSGICTAATETRRATGSLNSWEKVSTARNAKHSRAPLGGQDGDHTGQPVRCVASQSVVLKKDHWKRHANGPFHWPLTHRSIAGSPRALSQRWLSHDS